MTEPMNATRQHFTLDPDDRLRRGVITELMCNLELRFDEFEAAYGIRLSQAFASELVRNIAVVFDRYLGQQNVERFSRTV
jgi:oxygen-independent coproporphyrinogen III oxidase